MTEAEQLSKHLMDTALANKHKKFELISNLSTLHIAYTLLIAGNKIAKGFKKSADTSYASYLAGLKDGIDYVQLLINAKTYEVCYEFYKEEAKVLKSSIVEFFAYLFSGRFVWSILGGNRQDCDKFNFLTGETYD